jgi:hypothetical protein
MARKTDETEMTDAEIQRRQRSRNIAVALAIVGIGVLIYFVTIVRIQSGIEASLGGG